MIHPYHILLRQPIVVRTGHAEGKRFHHTPYMVAARQYDTGAESPWDLLEAQHHRLQLLMGRLRKAVAGKTPNVDALRHRFAVRLRRHFETEETTVFPILLATSAGAAREAVDFLLGEHAEIREILDTVEETPIKNGKFARAFEDLRERLHTHQMRERRVLYPVTERLCPDSLASVLRERLLAEPPDDE